MENAINANGALGAITLGAEQLKAQLKRSYKTDKKEIRSGYKSEKRAMKMEYKLKKKQLKADYKNSLPKEENYDKAINPPKRSVLEEIGNAITHGLGALFSIVALVLMLVNSDRPVEAVAACVYFAGLFIMFSMSCLYHCFRYGSKVKRLFRRFDYSSIYLLIGATFAPLLLCYIGGAYGLTFFIVQWAVIATGITFVGVFGPTKLRKLHFALYIILGWSALVFLPQMIAVDMPFFIYILAGGVVYSLGIIPFALKTKVSHFIWHIFVLGGAVLQWVGIFLYLYL